MVAIHDTKQKIEVKLLDGTWLEGKCWKGKLTRGKPIGGAEYLWLEEVFISDKEGKGTIPLAKEVYVPMSAVLFIVTKE